jgi:hypothetical protein
MPTYPSNLSTLFLELPFYLLTYLLTQLPTYISTYLHMHPPSYLPLCLFTYLCFLHNQYLTNYLFTFSTPLKSYLSFIKIRLSSWMVNIGPICKYYKQFIMEKQCHNCNHFGLINAYFTKFCLPNLFMEWTL